MQIQLVAPALSALEYQIIAPLSNDGIYDNFLVGTAPSYPGGGHVEPATLNAGCSVVHSVNAGSSSSSFVYVAVRLVEGIGNADDFVFDGWTLNGVIVQKWAEVHLFKVNADCTLSAIFKTAEIPIHLICNDQGKALCTRALRDTKSITIDMFACFVNSTYAKQYLLDESGGASYFHDVCKCDEASSYFTIGWNHFFRDDALVDYDWDISFHRIGGQSSSFYKNALLVGTGTLGTIQPRSICFHFVPVSHLGVAYNVSVSLDGALIYSKTNRIIPTFIIYDIDNHQILFELT
ncbi:MAG: hypothetical protein Q4F99_02880 [bacterium]|nr:hypothetical protein [bacterium]